MGRHPNNEAQSLNTLPCLDICELTRAGIFDPPGKSRRWNVSQTVADLAPFSRSGDLLIFGYHAVQIVERPCHFGGRRFYFVCDCGHRVTKLHSRGSGAWLCRHCHRLNYRCQMISPCDRLREKAQSIRRQLSGSVSMFDPFPRRPRGMHRTRYEYSRLVTTLRRIGQWIFWQRQLRRSETVRSP